MSDQELKDLVASLALAHKEIAAEQKENARQLNQFGLESRQANVRIEAEQKENARQFNLSNQQLMERMAASRAEVDKQIKQTQKQLGELGNKWGTFAEGMAIESIRKILLEKFNISVISERFSKRMKGESIEMDAFGYENSTINTAVIVEIKSHLRDDSVEQIERIMEDFPRFFPDHADKKLYGIIACVHAPDNIKNLLRKKGIYLAVLHDDIFELHDFKNFTPKDFNHL